MKKPDSATNDLNNVNSNKMDIKNRLKLMRENKKKNLYNNIPDRKILLIY